MSLNENEIKLELDTLYEVYEAKSADRGTSKVRYQDGVSLSIKGGSVDLHAITSPTQPATIDDMTLSASDENLSNTKYIGTARYIAFVQNTGITTSIIATNIKAKDLGEIL